MHNRAAVTSLIMLVLIALFVTFAPMVSSFSYFDTDWGMMSNAGYGLRPLLRNRLLRARSAGARSGGAHFADGRGGGGAGGGDPARCTVRLRLSRGKVDSVMMRLLEILNSFRLCSSSSCW